MTTARGIASVSVLVCLCGAAAAQSTTDESLVQELRRVGAALEKLIELQESQSLMGLVLKRIELLERRLDPLNRQLLDAEAEYRSLADNLVSLERMQEQHEAALAEEIRSGTDSPRSDTRLVLADIRRTQETNLERQKAARARQQQLEDDLSAQRREIEALDETFLEMFEEAAKPAAPPAGPR
jgi:hypothetical protein